MRRLARQEIDGREREVELLYPSMYFAVEAHRNGHGRARPETACAVNNIYLNGVRIAAALPDGQARYYLTDQVDSVKVVTDDRGLVLTSHEYLPFGESWITEGDEKNAPKYNSQELDKESGYYFYNARHYDPEIARFVTPDTVIDGELSTQGWNRFAYVHNNPIRYKDPTGHDAQDAVEGIRSLGNMVSALAPVVEKAVSAELKEVVQTVKGKIDNLRSKSKAVDVACKVLTADPAPGANLMTVPDYVGGPKNPAKLLGAKGLLSRVPGTIEKGVNYLKNFPKSVYGLVTKEGNLMLRQSGKITEHSATNLTKAILNKGTDEYAKTYAKVTLLQKHGERAVKTAEKIGDVVGEGQPETTVGKIWTVAKKIITGQ